MLGTRNTKLRRNNVGRLRTKFPSDLSMRKSHSQTVHTYSRFSRDMPRSCLVFCLFSTRYLVYIYEYDIKSSGSNTRATRPLGYSIQLDPM